MSVLLCSASGTYDGMVSIITRRQSTHTRNLIADSHSVSETAPCAETPYSVALLRKRVICALRMVIYSLTVASFSPLGLFSKSRIVATDGFVIATLLHLCTAFLLWCSLFSLWFWLFNLWFFKSFCLRNIN